MCRFSYHTHTTFCDGKNTPMEMAEAALRQGLTDGLLNDTGSGETDEGPRLRENNVS